LTFDVPRTISPSHPDKEKKGPEREEEDGRIARFGEGERGRGFSAVGKEGGSWKGCSLGNKRKPRREKDQKRDKGEYSPGGSSLPETLIFPQGKELVALKGTQGGRHSTAQEKKIAVPSEKGR